MTAGDAAALRRFGRDLVAVHDELRERLRALRAGVAAGVVDPSAFAFAPTSLQAHCLTFCGVLRAHHRGEDQGMFPVVLDVDPTLQSAIANLVQDHDVLAPMLVHLEDMASSWAEGSVDDLEHVARELDGVAAVLANHLAYEERTLVALLDGLDPVPGGTTEGSLAQALDHLPGPD